MGGDFTCNEDRGFALCALGPERVLALVLWAHTGEDELVHRSLLHDLHTRQVRDLGAKGGRECECMPAEPLPPWTPSLVPAPTSLPSFSHTPSTFSSFSTTHSSAGLPVAACTSDMPLFTVARRSGEKGSRGFGKGQVCHFYQNHL